MKIKCINGNCGYEFVKNNSKNIRIETQSNEFEQSDVLVGINQHTNELIDYVRCPLCRSHCIEIEE